MFWVGWTFRPSTNGGTPATGKPDGEPGACDRRPRASTFSDTISLASGGTNGGNPGGGGNGRANRFVPNTCRPSDEISAWLGDEPGGAVMVDPVGSSLPLGVKW